MKVKVISLPYIFQVLYVLCFIRSRYQVSVYRTNGPLVFLIFWKLMFKIRRLFFGVSDLGGLGFGEEVAVGLPKDIFEHAKLSHFWVSCVSLIRDESCSSSSTLEYMLPRLVSSATGMP